MLVVVLAEHHIQQSALVVENGNRIEFVIPDDVVCLDKRCVLGRGDELFKRSHKLFDFEIGTHAADAIVAACDHAQQFAVGCTVVSDGDCVVSLACNKSKHVGKRVVGREIAVGHDETCLVVLTLRTISASLSMDCEPNIKEIPPSLASAIASVSLLTDCMMAEVIGTLSESAGCSPLRNLTSGVFRLTFAGMQFSSVYPGMSKYSLKVLDG